MNLISNNNLFKCINLLKMFKKIKNIHNFQRINFKYILIKKYSQKVKFHNIKSINFLFEYIN